MTGPHPPSIPPRPKAGPDGRRTVSSRSMPVPDEVAAAAQSQQPSAAVVEQAGAPSGADVTPTPAAAAAPAPVAAPAPAPAPAGAAGRGPDTSSTSTPARQASAPAQSRPADDEPAQAPAAAAPGASEPGEAGPSTPEPGTAEAADDEPETQTALAAAVTATGDWFRRAGRATTTTVSSAYASITRPAPEDNEMTSTKPAPAAVPGAHDVPIAGWPGAAEAPRTAPGAPRPTGPRRVRLAISRVDPWSVMKLSFLLSFALGIIGVVAASVVWFTLDGLHVFAKLNDLVTTVAGADSAQQAMSYLSFGKIAAGAMLVGVVDVFLMTALCTIGAFLYNIVAALVGGLHVTMTDD